MICSSILGVVAYTNKETPIPSGDSNLAAGGAAAVLASTQAAAAQAAATQAAVDPSDPVTQAAATQAAATQAAVDPSDPVTEAAATQAAAAQAAVDPSDPVTEAASPAALGESCETRTCTSLLVCDANSMTCQPILVTPPMTTIQDLLQYYTVYEESALGDRYKENSEEYGYNMSLEDALRYGLDTLAQDPGEGIEFRTDIGFTRFHGTNNGGIITKTRQRGRDVFYPNHTSYIRNNLTR